MAKKESFVEHIAKRDENFSQWYTDVIKKADLVDYSDVKGCMVIKPYGYGIWELIQAQLDQRFKETGHKNAYFPLLIPESLLQKEMEHVEGFAPEVAWVTQGGHEVLQERLAIRPTSETIVCSMYSRWIQSYRDLPVLMNQWCNVLRWEKSTRPFLRTSEFLWQEGHTVHETEQEAEEETVKMLNVYSTFARDVLAIPVITGRKSESEKFAGAKHTYTMEACMQDGKALQMGTSHNLAQHFSKVFDIQFSDRNGELQYGYSTSWGVSTRMIGGLIMVHGDDRGLVLPPKVAPTQVMVIPIAQHKEGVLEEANKIYDKLKQHGIRVDIDDRENQSAGWKFNDCELQGIPCRIEIGPKDIEKNQVTICRRDTFEKFTASIDDIAECIDKLLVEIHDVLLEKAAKRLNQENVVVSNMDELAQGVSKGFVKAMWCEDERCEAKIKEETGATIRCIPFENEKVGDKCVYCGKETHTMVYVAKAY